MIKKVIVAISIILVVLLSSVGFLYAADNSSNKTYHVTASSNNGGTITPKGNQFVEKGYDSPIFTITADEGYEIAWVRIDNAKIKDIKSNPYTKTFEKVDKNHTIHAHFSKINNGNSNNSGGTITTEGNQPVQKGNGIASNTSKFFGFFHNLFLKISKHFRS